MCPEVSKENRCLQCDDCLKWQPSRRGVNFLLDSMHLCCVVSVLIKKQHECHHLQQCLKWVENRTGCASQNLWHFQSPRQEGTFIFIPLQLRGNLLWPLPYTRMNQHWVGIAWKFGGLWLKWSHPFLRLNFIFPTNSIEQISVSETQKSCGEDKEIQKKVARLPRVHSKSASMMVPQIK